MDNPEIDPHKHNELIFDKGAKAIHGVKIISSTNSTGTTGLPMRKREKNEPTYKPHTLHKNKSKWITDLNVKYGTMKILENNIEENLNDLGFGDNFFFFFLAITF